ncbi:MAG: hypothetical protein LBK07_07180 [Tannerella sp.]|nr:hypothetical protein [Tannerella sp.]
MNFEFPLYRRLFCRGGFGIHSPFAFDLITKVVEERCARYFYRDIEAAHRQLTQDRTAITCGGSRTTVCRAFRRCGITPGEGKFLFRLANHCKPLTFLTAGSAMGFVPLCLTGYAAAARCIMLEEERDFAATATRLVGGRTDVSIEIIAGADESRAAAALTAVERLDCLYLGREVDVRTRERLFAQCRPFLHGRSICIVAGIHGSTARKRQWEALCLHPDVTVSLDLYTTGVLFFHPHLNRRTYRCLIR